MGRRLEEVEIEVNGRVQGVGFRYFVFRAAQSLDIKGWVKNMPDGSVLLRATGESGNMDRFRRELKKGPIFSKVKSLRERTLPEGGTASFTEFQIQH